MSERKQQGLWEYIAVRAITAALVLACGLAGMVFLKRFKKAPGEVEPVEAVLHVETIAAERGDYATTLWAYGTAQVLHEIPIAAEVAGLVTATHPRLDAGEVIAVGETLFEIDVRDYTSAVSELEAQVSQFQAVANRLNRQLELEQERMERVRRNGDLANRDFERVKALLEKDNIGTRAGVEQAERAWNAAADQVAQLENLVALLPLQLAETEQSRKITEARLLRARLNAERCIVKAPCTGRVKRRNVEIGQTVAPGQMLVTLADDTTLELHVPLDSTDARQRLVFEETARNDSAWFGPLAPAACAIRCTADLAAHVWTGRLARVVELSTDTRTMVVAVRVESTLTGRPAQKDALPLTAGMFCSVAIPGKALKEVIRLPRQCVTFDRDVYVARNGRLKTLPVEVVWFDDAYAYVSAGLDPGDVVITTRLVDPLEETRVAVSAGGTEADR